MSEKEKSSLKVSRRDNRSFTVSSIGQGLDLNAKIDTALFIKNIK